MIEPDGTKRCRRCKQVLPLSAFYARKASRDGAGPYCRTCGRADAEQRRRAKGAKPRPVKRTLEPGETKECRTCHRVLDATEFYPSKLNSDGRVNTCKRCDLARSRQWQTANRERTNEIQRAYYRRKADKELSEWMAQFKNVRPSQD